MAASSVETALAASASQVGTDLAALPEDQWYDRKNILIKPKDLCRHLVAFAKRRGWRDQGGVIVVGIQGEAGQGVSAYPNQVTPGGRRRRTAPSRPYERVSRRSIVSTRPASWTIYSLLASSPVSGFMSRQTANVTCGSVMSLGGSASTSGASWNTTAAKASTTGCRPHELGSPTHIERLVPLRRALGSAGRFEATSDHPARRVAGRFGQRGGSSFI
jgi:hypothetical protein